MALPPADSHTEDFDFDECKEAWNNLTPEQQNELKANAYLNYQSRAAFGKNGGKDIEDDRLMKIVKRIPGLLITTPAFWAFLTPWLTFWGVVGYNIMQVIIHSHNHTI